MSQNSWNIQQILNFLPHRSPFLLIDKVLDLDPVQDPNNFVGRKIEAIKNVTYNEPFFPGHFPMNPVMPGVLILEALCQACAILGGRQVPGKQVQMYIAGFDNARFRQPVVPGDVLHLHGECTKDRGAIVAFRAEAKVQGKLVAEADLLAKQFVLEGIQK